MDINSCIVNFGHISPFFLPGRGIRQGCLLLANLFIIIVKILDHAIRKEKNINGIVINRHTFKISQHADDTYLLLQDEHSHQAALNIFKTF